jgi:hypothetical protein
MEDERRIVHPDGWMFYVCDCDEGCVSIGYREWDTEERRYKESAHPLVVAIDYAEQLAEAIQFFADRESDR